MVERYYDALERRDENQRQVDIAKALPEQVKRAQSTSAYKDSLKGIDAERIDCREALVALPVTRKADVLAAQGKGSALGGFSLTELENYDHIFQSPGPIYEPGNTSHDWWRFGRFLNSLGLGKGDIVHNCFAYHFTPAGMMFENGARAVGATVFPAGTGQTELQARAMADIGATAYAGTPDYLKAILEKADELGLDMTTLKTAAVSGGPLFPQLREYYAERGITCRQCYGTADLGHLAFETEAMEGMIVDEGVIIEIVTPGTGEPVPEGEIGEMLVTTLNPDYPLMRFATGDMSSILPGQSPCGRTNMRIRGWQGRADQATKVKGMFVRPEQVADLVNRLDGLKKARVEVSHDGSTDVMLLRVEADGLSKDDIAAAARDVVKLRAEVQIEPTGSLPKDGVVIEDKRDLG